MDSKVSPAIPSSLKEFAPDWLSQILGFPIDPSTFSLNPFGAEENGCLSIILRISCSREGAAEKMNLIVKLMPEGDTFRHIVISMGMDKAEIQAYQSVLPALTALLPELTNYICPFLFGKIEESKDGHSSILILEDLKPLGYSTLDPSEYLTNTQIENGISFLATLHFAGSFLEELQGKSMDVIFPSLKLDATTLASGYQSGMPTVFPILLSILSNSSTEVRESYASLEPSIHEIILKIFKKSGEVPSLVHGDPWKSNILFNKDPSLPAKGIDWQIMGYRDAVLDLGVFILSSLPTSQITVENINNFLRKYYTLFQKLSDERKVPNICRRSWMEFLEAFNTVGLSFATIWTISSIIARRNDERLIKIFQFFHEMGVISYMTKVSSNGN